jgi:RHS repeat-associated protein
MALSSTRSRRGSTKQVAHANGVTETIARDPDWMARPASISTSGVDGGANWSSGTYSYDGSGNVEAIGNDRFRYDKVSRLLESRMRLVPGQAGTEHTQTFSYDGFGNLLGIVGVGGTTLDTTASTNRLADPDPDPNEGTEYDAAGNLTLWNGNSYTFDRLNRMSERVTAGANSRQWKFLYTADDERLWSADISGIGEQRVMLRDLDGRPLREYAYEPPAVDNSLAPGHSPLATCPASPPDDIFCDGFESGNTSGWNPPVDDLYRDWIYRGTQLLAADGSEQDRSHFHLDHLGTPRQITGVIPPGALAAQHAYLPYGAELPGSTQNHERLRFTGHERDLSNFSNPADDLDYLHARHSSPILGRFLSVDPVRGEQSVPQSWNRYTYVKGNPVSLIDPTGMKDKRSTSDKALLEDKEVLAAVDEILELSNLTSDLTNRQEAGAVVATTGTADFSIDGGVVTQGHINKVNFNLIQTDAGLKTAYGNELAATIHSHPGTGKVEVGGEKVTIVGGRASDADKNLAATTGKPAFILNSRQSMIRVDPNSGASQRVLTGKDYRAFLNRARAARMNSEKGK